MGQGTRQLAEGPAGVGGELATARRELDATRAALEKSFAESPLKAGDAVADRRRGDVQRLGGGLERAATRGELEGLQRKQVARREGRLVGQKASAGRAIRVAAPALIWWLSDVVCGRTRAR